MVVSTKFRELEEYSLGGISSSDFGGGWIDTVVPFSIRTCQTTTSEGHRWPPKGGDRLKDVGGSFDTVKSVFEDTYIPNGSWNAGAQKRKYSGHLFPDGVPRAFASANTLAQRRVYLDADFPRGSNLVSLGTKAISSSIPTSPSLDASVSLAELYREGIPSIIGSQILKGRSGLLKDAAGEYLNFEFGWKPLVSDLKNAAKAILESEETLKQLRRDSGRNVHRERVFPEEITQQFPTPLVGRYPPQMGSPIVNRSGTLAKYQKKVVRSWFTGDYTYHYDDSRLSDVSRIATQARVLYGIKLTPDVLWNLAPWSWLADWVVNIGPVLTNVSAFANDGLVLRRGYIMQQTDYMVYDRLTGCSAVSGPDISDIRATYRVVRKQRDKATPFGFGLNNALFTGRQWSILAALGITRAPRVL